MGHRTLMSLTVILLFGALLSIGVIAKAQLPTLHPSEESSESVTPRTPPPVILAMQEPVRSSATPMLAEGTVIPLLLTREVKVKEAQPGDTVDFVLSQDLWYRDTLVARRGTPVQVVVQTAEKAKWLSRGSRLGFDIQSLKLLNSGLVPLRGEFITKGGINSVSGGAFSVAGEGSGGSSASGLASGGGGVVDAAIMAAPLVVGAFGLIAPGKNQDARAGDRADAWVAQDVALDMDSFRALQSARDPVATGKVQVVRAYFGRLVNRDLYCNGIPLAHLTGNRKYVADFKPGWYRFAIHPKKPPVEIFVVPGDVYTLVALPDSIRLVDSEFSSDATHKVKLFSLGSGIVPRSAQEMVNDAKPVNKLDLYGDASQCEPLAEEFVPAAAPTEAP